MVNKFRTKFVSYVIILSALFAIDVSMLSVQEGYCSNKNNVNKSKKASKKSPSKKVSKSNRKQTKTVSTKAQTEALRASLTRPLLLPKDNSDTDKNDLERVIINNYPKNAKQPSNSVTLNTLPKFSSQLFSRSAALTQNNDYVFFTVNKRIQTLAETLALNASVPHIAMVLMDPKTGKILALAQKSSELSDPLTYAQFPAASLFKVITAAAALEQGAIETDTPIRFRGGIYTLNQWNYKPDYRKDRRFMSVSEAMGKSCNPVFGRIAFNFLDSDIIRNYVVSFGFNSQLPFELPLDVSHASIPDDELGLSRTAAGFGDVTISPIHAAAIMSGIANDGIIPKPMLIDKVVSPQGAILYQAKPEGIRRLVQAETAGKLLDMMKATTTIGTSRKAFNLGNQSLLPGIDVAAKTGTLRGEAPEGINNWFIATAPASDPKVAVAVLVVGPSLAGSKASHFGRQLLQAYFEDSPLSQ